MLDLFKEIYQERCILDATGEYVKCVSCGRRIYEPNVRVHNFSHNYSKQSHPEHKWNKEEISIRCYSCHQRLDFGTTEKENLNF